MEHIKTVRIPTGKSCTACSGTVDELFEKKYGKSNGIIGSGHHTPSWIESVGFCCNKCFIAYILPEELSAKKETAVLENVSFQLSLSKCILKKSIGLKDIPDTLEYNKKKAAHKNFSLVPYYKKATRIPRELKVLKAGDVLYRLATDPMDRDGSIDYSIYILTPEKRNKTFRLLSTCFK